MNRVTNTSEEIKTMGLAALLMGTAAGIEASEARGQSELVVSDVLPADMGRDRDVLEGWGVRILDPVPGDPLFVNAELPAGWKKQRTDHSMWSDLVDDKGRKRASIFYKAAFYDRGAHINVCHLLHYSTSYDSETATYGFVEASDGTVLFATEVVPFGLKRNHKDYYTKTGAVREELCDRCLAWLKENYPDFDSYNAYWDADLGAGVTPPNLNEAQD
jgi:hypothetical protein